MASYLVAILSSLVIHGLVIFALVMSWEPDTRQIVIQPQYIQAELVQLAATQRPEPKKIAPVVRSTPKQPVQQQQALAKKKQLEAERRAAEAKAQALAQAQRARQAELQRKKQAEQRAAKQAEFTEMLQREQAALKVQEEQKVANSYMQLIQQQLSENWSRPPSARLGMEVVVELSLVPTGRIAGVAIVKSSGDLAFDRAAEQAAFRVDQFTELQNMPAQIFEKYFRRLVVVFSPEDLRL
jgi:colicin import membrane protein